PAISAGGVEELPCRLLSAVSLLELQSYREAEALVRPARGRLGPLEPWGGLFLAEAIVGSLGWDEEDDAEAGEADAGGSSAAGGSATGTGTVTGTDTDTTTDTRGDRAREAFALLAEAEAADPQGPLGARAKQLLGMLQLRR